MITTNYAPFTQPSTEIEAPANAAQFDASPQLRDTPAFFSSMSLQDPPVSPPTPASLTSTTPQSLLQVPL